MLSRYDVTIVTMLSQNKLGNIELGNTVTVSFLQYTGIRSAWVRVRLGSARGSIWLGTVRYNGFFSARLEAELSWLKAWLSVARWFVRLNSGIRPARTIGLKDWLHTRLQARGSVGTRLGIRFGAQIDTSTRGSARCSTRVGVQIDLIWRRSSGLEARPSSVIEF